MYNSVQERPIEPTGFQFQNPSEFDPVGAGYEHGTWSGDAVRRAYPQEPSMSGNGPQQIFGGIGNIAQGLWNMSPPAMLWNLMQQIGTWMQQQQQDPGEQYFNSASGGSNGDPHLSFNGQTWDNMGSQPDLLHSDSFQGGFQLSTQTTAPQANGVTYNQSATLTTNYGDTSVTLDKNGNATISQGGYSFAMQPGTSYDLGNGEFAQRNQDGSLAITCDNGQGGQIATTMKQNGQGVDVNASANNVDLGGALVNGNHASGVGGGYLQPMTHQHRHPTPQPYLTEGFE